ncbi:Dynein heavy chain, N-terminal region 2 [Nesidiocoris tenuis]|uniref:Dynein heavy chain, N-terminal region 2 n=1 Tax=Nesidiocoris tenuis TaxID=355587 RepID=A0ABN7AJJ1_9HEMI|nr:Dynein heavy chain, N-terminal region 2 [Nesidiocoris tenuis]
MMEVEDWSDSYAIAQKKAKNAQQEKFTGPLCPMKSLRALISVRKHLREKLHNIRRGLPKIYSGCRHDIKRFSWNEFMGSDVLMEHGYSVQINYSAAYEVAIREIELFEELGYEIPEDLRRISVVKDSLHADFEAAVKMIRIYSAVIKSLKPTQVAALKPYISNVEKTLYFGFTQYTWSSLNIAEFCESVMTESNTLEYLANQLRHMEASIESIVMDIIEVDSFQCPTSDVYSFQVFFKFSEYRRKEAVAYVKRLYHKLTRILYRMECLLFSEMTGSSEYLLLYYIWAENTMFNGLVAYAVRNLSKYEEFLLGIPKHKFCIEALFNDGTISVNPDLAQIAFQLSTQAENIVGTLSTLVRWQEGTCHFVPQLESSNSGSIHRYSFVEDLVQCPEVKSALVHIYETVSVVVEHIDRYLEKWSKFSHLWTFDSEITMKQFLSQKPTLAEYDECFSFYHNTMEKLKSRKPAASIYCVRIMISKMTTKIHEIAYKWKSIIGDQLLASSRALVVEMKQKTQELFEQLSQPIISLETFQKVLLAVNGCSAYQVEAEISLKEIYERHHLLRMWKLKIPKSDNLNAYDVEKSWHKIRRIAAYRTYLLAPTLKLFVTKANEVCDLFLKTSLVFVKKYSNEGPGTYLHDLSKGAAILGLFKIEFAETEAKRKEIVQAETLFDLQPMNFNVFCEAHEMFKDEVLVYDLYNRLQAEKENWSLVLWNNFNPKKLLAGIDSYLNEFEELSGKCKRMPISLAIKKHMLDFKRSIPLMTDLQNKALRQRHWNELMVKTGHEFNMDPLHTKMKHLFSMKLYEHYSLVAEIIANAQKEADIETKLSIISERWIDEELPIVQHFQPNGDNGVQYTLGDVTISLKSGLESLIEELLVMKKSKFSGPFKAQIEDWAFKVSETLEVLILWETVQKWWMNLEHIYKNSPEDTPGADIFRTAYVNYAEITRKAKSKPNVFMQCLHPNKKAALQSIYNNVELCSLRLRVYLNTQRELCPRFYLLTDGEMMDILGGNMDPAYTLIHKMFIGVQSLLTVGQNGKHGSKHSESHRNECMQAVGMISPEQEVLEFINGVNPRDKAHLFMLNILEEMRLSLQDATYKAVLDFHNSRDNRKEWVSQHLGCTVLTSNQVGFCCMVEKAFMQMTRGSQRAMRKLLAKQTKELDEDTRVIRENLKMNDRKKLTTLLIEDAHSKDIVERFVTLNVMNAEEFEWSSQLRFYWSPDSKTLEIKQCEGSFDYGFEYMGLVHRQVITPLTERARLTITQALTMRQGTAIIGPTATGKKETIKDLADVLGVMYLLINCGSMFTLSNLNQWLKTVYSCGIWTCLDKFDRIDLSTQSAFSTTLFSARQALLASADYFYCEGYQIPLSRSTNVFITMNPGYKGRHCLPESMKSLFRPVVCMHPDTEHICTITLISEGFIEAKVLARKMSCLNKVAKTQLSEAKHYDFGLKVIKSILCVAGLLKRKMPSVSEKALLKNALRDVFAPKLLDDDAVFFNGLLEDFFPAVELFRVGNAEEEVAISDSLSSSGYIKIPNQIHKIAQLQAITDMWHSVIVLGPTSGGKSVIIDTFIRTQAALGKPMKPFYLNPNICSMAELFGQYNDELTEWKDGIITQFLKDSAHHNETVSVVFDGSMDSEWIENMSTVMDDNKTLSLPNGDLINLGDQVFFLFETGHLENCSPATVSRNGLIYVNPAELGFSAYWQRWAHSRMDDYERELLHELYETFVPVCFEMLENDDLKTEVPLSTINMVAHLCLVIEAQLPIIEPPYRNDVEEPLKRSLTSKQELTCVFIQALYLSLGAVVTEECRIPFDGKIKELSAMSLVNEEPDSPISCCELPCRLLTLFSYLYQANDKQWVPWSSQVANYEHNNFRSPHQILVPNEELTKMRWTLELLNKVKRPILLIGESGSAKTSIVRQYMSTIHNEKWERLFINLTPLYGSEKLQQLIERKLMKTMRNYWEPKGNKKLLVFIDDLDMAIMNHVNSKKTNEFLKFFIEKQALLLRNRDVNRSVVHVNDVYCIGAMGKQATNTGAVDPRFLSLFAVYRMNTATMSTMKYVFGAVLGAHTATFSSEIRGMVSDIIDTTLLLFKEAQTTFLPSPIKFHYIFSVRDLTQIFHGLLLTREELYTDKCHFLRAWRNEVTRVLCDRLMNEEDQRIMNNRINEAVAKNFTSCHHYVMRNPLLFGDFRNAMIQTELRKYEDLLDYQAVYHLFTEIMLSFNKTNESMELILFEDALEHVTRIHRVLRHPRGHVLLLGAPNSGKRSLTKLASFTAGK